MNFLFNKLYIYDDSYLAHILIWGFWQLIVVIGIALIGTVCVAFVDNTIQPFIDVIRWFTEYTQGTRIFILTYVVVWIIGGVIRKNNVVV